MTDETPDDWPPPAGDLWLVHGSMGAPIGTMNEDGTDLAVLLRIGARRNHHGDELDETFVLMLDDYVGLMAGLMSLGTVAFGRETVQAAMAERLGVPADKRDRAVRAFHDVMKDDDR